VFLEWLGCLPRNPRTILIYKQSIFGHWHSNADEVIDGTRFICLNELSYCDIDVNTLEVNFPEMQHKKMKM